METYLHFTSEADAKAIVASGELWECSFVSGVYAVAVGGELVPGVQATKLGRAKDRTFAVVFTTEEAPACVFPEEVIWRTKSLKIQGFVVPAAEAQALLKVSLEN